MNAKPKLTVFSLDKHNNLVAIAEVSVHGIILSEISILLFNVFIYKGSRLRPKVSIFAYIPLNQNSTKQYITIFFP